MEKGMLQLNIRRKIHNGKIHKVELIQCGYAYLSIMRNKISSSWNNRATILFAFPFALCIIVLVEKFARPSL